MPSTADEIKDAAQRRAIADEVEKKFDIAAPVAAQIVEDIEEAVYSGCTGAATVLTDLGQEYGNLLDPDLDLGRVLTFVAARYGRAVDLD